MSRRSCREGKRLASWIATLGSSIQAVLMTDADSYPGSALKDDDQETSYYILQSPRRMRREYTSFLVVKRIKPDNESHLFVFEKGV